MSASALDTLIGPVIAGAERNDAASTDLFGSIRTVVDDPAAAAAAGVKPAQKRAKTTVVGATPSRKRKPSTTSASASAVRAAVSIVDDELDGEAAEGSEQPVTIQARPGKNFAPITRPNGELYRPRVLTGGRSDVEMIRTCRANDVRVMLYGYPGCGKTALIEAAFGEDAIVAEGHADFEVSDFVGGYVPQPDGSYLWVNGPLTLAMQEGRPLFIDDATLISPGVLARVYPAMDGRRQITLREHNGEVVKAKDGFFVVAAHNPNAPGAVLSEALSSRFALHISVESDLKMAIAMGVNKKAVRVASALRTMRDNGDGFGWAPEMRELLDFNRVEKTFDEKTAIANMISTAPMEAREEVIKVLRTWDPAADALRLRGDAPAAGRD